ncbi:MAG: DUF58 domain-containing protein [Verrucomicrobia bacterium]|nr:DUF58 domain-containing protein [Cytophagales bacterium]
MKTLLSRLRKYEIQIRKAVDSQMRGDFHSIFKGSGITFDDVRAYQYGDDVRTLDWNVSAKGHGMFVKIFKEEKEQTVFFLMDVSASQEIGLKSQQKIDLAKEICGVLALSAINEAGQVGMICFSDQKEKYMKPGKGLKHGYELLLNLFQLEAISKKTDLNAAIIYALQRIKRKSVIILVSDFVDENYERSLTAMSQKHDLVVIRVADGKEEKIPQMGIVPVWQQESGKMLWVNTSSTEFKQTLAKHFQSKTFSLEKFCRKHDANYLSVQTGEDFIPKLIRLFKVRNLKK